MVSKRERAMNWPLPKCLNGIERSCNASSLKLKDSIVKCMDREQWKDFANCKNEGVISQNTIKHTFGVEH